MTDIVIQGPALDRAAAAAFAAAIGGDITHGGHGYTIATPDPVSAERLAELRATAAFDVNMLPPGFAADRVRLLITDMDSTLINIECVDEIADFLGIKPRVAEITAAAMRGEIDFEGSLRRRVALLKGLETAALERVYSERLRLNPGAEVLLAALRARGVKTALVSGGFTFFTERLTQRLAMDFSLANRLEIRDDRLTGKVQGSIVGAAAKAAFLRRLCTQLDIDPAQAVAVGDGANDLEMLHCAGLSIAYHAKPAVQREADTALNYCGLDGVIGLLEAGKNNVPGTIIQ